MAKRLQIRRDTVANWEKVNPILLQGEIGYVLDNKGDVIGHKVGNGFQNWKDLPYYMERGAEEQREQNEAKREQNEVKRQEAFDQNEAKRQEAFERNEYERTPLLKMGDNNELEASYDKGVSWKPISEPFENNIHIQGYVNAVGELPTGAAIGTAFGVKDSTYTEANPKYRVYVYTSNGWVDNGLFGGISAGVVQETGDGENVVMSQKAVSGKLFTINTFNSKLIFDNDKRVVYNDNATEYLSIQQNGYNKVVKFESLEYGAVNGNSGNIALVYTEAGIKFKQALLIDKTDKIIALVRAKFLEQVDGNFMFNFVVDHVSFCQSTYTVISGGRIIESNSRTEREPELMLVNDRNINLSELSVYDNILTGALVEYKLGSHFRIPVLPGFWVRIEASEKTTSTYTFLENVNTLKPIAGTKRFTMQKGTVAEFVIPDGCRALYVVKINGALEDETPRSVLMKNSPTTLPPTQAQCYSAGTIIFDNERQKINLFGNQYIIVPKVTGEGFRLVELSDIPYGMLYGKNGFGALAVKADDTVIVDNYDNLSKDDILLAVFRVKFIKFIEDDLWKYNIEYIAYSTLTCKVIDAPSLIPYSGNRLEVKPTLRCTTFGKGVFEPWVNGCAAQGMAIYKGYMFQLHNKGIVRVWDIEKPSPILVNQFNLGSYGDTNHANSAQFYGVESDTGFPLIYIGGCHKDKREMYVEMISTSNSELVQTIKFSEDIDSIPTSNVLSCIVGDDGYIWVNNHYLDKSYITKLRLPSLSEGNIVTLDNSDVIDSWHIDYDDYNETRQDLSVYNGKLFYLYGGTYGRRGVKVFDTLTHQLINHIDLTNYLTEELEGIDIYNNEIWISTLADVAYILEL